MKYKLEYELEEILRKNISFYRNVKGLTKYALAEKLGVDHSYISKIELGKKEMSLGLFYRISQELGVSMDVLFSENIDNVSLKNINAMLAGKADKDIRFIEKIVKAMIDELEKR